MIRKVVLLFLSVALMGCAGANLAPSIKEKQPGAKKGYMVVSIKAKAGNFETPPYLPTKLEYELRELLKAEGLFAETGAREGKGVSIMIHTEARYRGGASGRDDYLDLQSRVLVHDPNDPSYGACITLVAFNGYGAVLSDFVERTHAKEMAEAIKSLLK